MGITAYDFARKVDATLSHSTATKSDFLELISDAKKYRFYSIIGPRCYVPLAAEKLAGSQTLVGAGCCFPAGHDPTEMKAQSAQLLVSQGAQEIDMVMNIGYLKSKMYREIENDILAVREAVGESIPLKCIIEVCFLSDNEIRESCQLLINSRVDFVKTATGLYGPTTFHHIDVISKEVRDNIQIKAAGGIQTLDTVKQMIDLGVSRFGISIGNVHAILGELR